ncbi:MAG TPA: Hpt domain-containing protein, partial [Thermoanaerobaculia bacterium]|nr:Hpt domain-containing protein [Thermoanaerobaculia bacterium]
RALEHSVRGVTPPQYARDRPTAFTFPVSQTNDPLDREVLATLKSLRKQGKRDIVAIMLQTYRDQCVPMIEAIRKAIESNDVVTLEGSAHELKGSSLTIGAREVGRLSASLETEARGGTTTGATALLPALEHELRRVSDAIVRELGGE